MSDMQVANTIRKQIGNKALFLIGAKNFVATDHGLRFRVGRNKLNANVVEVKLNGKDLYDVIFWSIRGTSAKVKKQVDDVYNEDLTKIIGHELGLVTSFPKIKFAGKDEGLDEAGKARIVRAKVTLGTTPLKDPKKARAEEDKVRDAIEQVAKKLGDPHASVYPTTGDYAGQVAMSVNAKLTKENAKRFRRLLKFDHGLEVRFGESVGARGTDPSPVGEYGPIDVIVTQKQETRDIWTCPHCENEIGEKELYYDGEQHFHRVCKHPIALPPPTQDQIDAIQHFFSIGESQTLCMVGGCVHTGQCIKHNVVNESDTCLETGSPINEADAYAVREPVELPKKFRQKEKPSKPGPITVSVYLPREGGDPAALIAALKSDKELGGAVTKTPYGEVHVSVGAATYREAEDMVRDALKRIGWEQQNDRSANLPGPYYPMPASVYSESDELLYEGPLHECLKFQRVVNEATTLSVPVVSVAAMRKAQKKAAAMAKGNTANDKVWRTAKKTKQLVNYTDKSPDPNKRCGDCVSVQLAQHGCRKVAGSINQDGVCDLFKAGIKA